MPTTEKARGSKSPEPVPSTEVQYLLVGTLVGAILLLIVFSLLSTTT
jgi:hypothetical protein